MKITSLQNPSHPNPQKVIFWVYALELLKIFLGKEKLELAKYHGKHTPDTHVGGVCSLQRHKRVITSSPQPSNP